ncbi:SDR family oxidoreductase [Winogradskya humida]|nr:SDR family oxidoreductase [Actinoplanes humidus]
MRIFVTGATGYIGSAVTRELLTAGHDILALARTEPAAEALTLPGVEVHRGSLEDRDSLRAGAMKADGVVHAAFASITGGSDRAASARAEYRAVEAIGGALKGTGKPLVVASGTLALPPGRLGTELDAADPGSIAAAVGLEPSRMLRVRIPNELAVLGLGAHGVRSSVVRLAPTVHGEGDRKGFAATLIATARARGVSAYVGDGGNHWPAVHRLDAARLFRLAVESAPAGSRLHAVGEEGVPFREIAEAIGRHLGLPATSIPAAAAGDHFGYLATLVTIDNLASSDLTQQSLHWQPTHPTLTEDIAAGRYEL